MNILHYTLGLPPYRSGGLTSYATDLMSEQVKQGYNVFLLYANTGIFSFQFKSFKYENTFSGINVYRLKCKLPISLLHGIKKPKSFIYSGITETDAKSFLRYQEINIIHIHTLMGLPIEILYAAKKLKIKVIFTTHDYFGLCLKVNFIDYLGNFCENPSSEKCTRCNYTSPSNLFLKIRNDKNILFFKKHIKNYFIQKKEGNSNCYTSKNDENLYALLLEHYKEMFSLIELFHFNSSITYSIYKKYLPNINGEIIPITHSGIQNNRVKKEIKTNIQLGFIGSLEKYKGFPLLKKVLITLFNDGITNWQLNVWGNHIGIDKDCNLIHYMGTFNKDTQARVYSNMNLLIVSSLCKETFGLVTLEALSYGVPVLVSSNVGAKDIINEYDKNFIFNNEKELTKILLKCLINNHILIDYNNKILDKDFSLKINDHAKKMISFYGV